MIPVWAEKRFKGKTNSFVCSTTGQATPCTVHQEHRDIWNVMLEYKGNDLNIWAFVYVTVQHYRSTLGNSVFKPALCIICKSLCLTQCIQHVLLPLSAPEPSICFHIMAVSTSRWFSILVENSICKQLCSVLCGSNHNRCHFTLYTPSKFVLVTEHAPVGRRFYLKCLYISLVLSISVHVALVGWNQEP